MSIASLEAKGVEEDAQKELLTRCGNCRWEFENETAKIAKINIGTIDHYQNVLENTVDDERVSVSVVQALLRIYGYPINCSQDGPWSEKDNCSLCHKCVDALTDFYRAFLELRKLTDEASYISRGFNQIYKCIEKRFSSGEKVELWDEKGQNEASTKIRLKRISKKSASISPRKVVQDKKSASYKDSKKISDSGIPEENVDSTACVVEVKLETFLQGSSETLQGDPPRQENKQNQEEISEEPVRGTTEVISPSGQIIRQSTRTRKVKKLIDLGESVQRKPSVIEPGEKRKGRFRTQNVAGKDDFIEDICKIVLPKNDDDRISDDYQTNLKTLQNGRFICPEPKCLKAFKGIKMLNKHAMQHSKKAKFSMAAIADSVPGGSGSNLYTTTPEVAVQENSMEEIQAKILVTPGTIAITHVKQFKCEHCDKRFLLKKMYEKHLSSHENQRAQCRCTVCDKKFSTAFSLARHISSIHDATESKMSNNDDKLQIDQIGEESTLSADIEESERKTEQNCDLILKCNQCNKEFKKKSQFRMHILFHNDKEPRFGCSKCPKTFFQPNGLRRHMLLHTMENPLVCYECDKVFERHDHYKRHVDMVHNQKKQKRKKVDPKNDPDHTCKECHKTFSRKEYLSLHMRIHTGEKPHMCSICGKQFRDPRNLAQHLVTHKTDRPFCCSVCGLTFKRAHHLNDHEGTHRQNVARPFACTFPHCEKAFKLRKHLVSHELVHSGSKDHPCHVCGRAFSRKDNLRQHINKIHGKEFADDMKVVLDQQREKYRQAQMQKGDVDAMEPNNTEDSLELENILGETEASTVSSEPDLLASDDGQIAEVLCIIPSIGGTLKRSTHYTYSPI